MLKKNIIKILIIINYQIKVNHLVKYKMKLIHNNYEINDIFFFLIEIKKYYFSLYIFILFFLFNYIYNIEYI